MSEFLLAINFTANSPEGMVAQWRITDDNSFLFDQGVQLQPYWPGTTAPPLKFVTIDAKSVAFTADGGGASAQQGVRVTLAVSAKGPTLSGNIPYLAGPEVGVSYQFLGFKNMGSLGVGDFSIPFPSS